MPKKKNEIKTLERNEHGLLAGVDYHVGEDGFINWRKMVEDDHLVPNKSRTQETDVSKLEDGDLLILLAGIKNLAHLRGFESVKYRVENGDADSVTAVCEIQFSPNFETGHKSVTFSAIGDATVHNTKGFGRQFLGPVAENRAFVRCVKSFLRINVVGQDEMGDASLLAESNGSSAATSAADPHSLLSSVMQEKGVSFDNLREKLVVEGKIKESEYKSLQDIPKSQIFALIKRLKTIKG